MTRLSVCSLCVSCDEMIDTPMLRVVFFDSDNHSAQQFTHFIVIIMCAKRIKFIMTRLSVCSHGVSCNEMIDTPMLLVVKFQVV